ncbi:hypothetical protein PS15p_210236 [Mucor circinelloides]
MESFWTDHALLRAQFIFSSDRQGSGLWRTNPRLASDPFFTNLLFPAIDEFFTTVELTESIGRAVSIDPATPHTNWDAFKSLVQEIAKRVSRDKSSVLKRQCKRLQRKRNRICRQYPDQRIHMTENQRVRASHNWRENGNTSAGFLKQTIETRAVKKSITRPLHLTTNTLCTNPLTMQSAAASS